MGCLWRQHGEERRWQSEPLQNLSQAEALASLGVRLETHGRGTDRIVVLFVGPGVDVLVNGQPVVGGLHVLRHQEEILVGGDRIFYSAESKPEIVPFRPEDGARPTKCGVCRVALQDGDQVVRCPQCGRLFHQDDSATDPLVKKCWTYRAQCLCTHPTSLSGEPTWQPENDEAFHGR